MEELGFLPGNLWEKMEPYMFSFTGNLDKIFKNPSITKELIEWYYTNFPYSLYKRGNHG